MSAQKRHANSCWAIVFALGLLLQTLAAAYAAAADSHLPLLDTFGNPLCITSDASTGDGDTPHHGGNFGCCTLASGPVLGGPPPNGAAIAIPTPRLQDILTGPRFVSVIRFALLQSARPRAPPAKLAQQAA